MASRAWLKCTAGIAATRAASVVALADTSCGYATIAHLPEGAHSFTIIELKSNHLGTLTEGVVACVATAQHMGGPPRSGMRWSRTRRAAASWRSFAAPR